MKTALFKKLLCVLLASLFLPVLSACGDTTAETTAETAAPETETTPVETEPAITCSVPADVTLSGASVRILHYIDQVVPYQNIMAAEITGETLNDAIFQANTAVMEELDCVFEHLENDGINTAQLEKAFTAGDDSYELVYGTQWKIAPLVTKHMFVNLHESEDNYLDLEKPWWYQGYIAETMVDDKHTYFVAGDASPDVFRRSSMMILNTDLLKDIGSDVDTVYEAVLDGSWTFDMLLTMVDSLYIDANGDGQRDEKDTFGFVTWTRSDMDHLLIGSGIRTCTRDNTGKPVVDFYNEQSITAVENLHHLFWGEGSYYVEQVDTFGKLENNEVLFLLEKFSRLDKIRDIGTQFTILPVAKLDESIDHYSSLIHDDALVLCIPIISQSAKNTTAVMEKLGYHYYEEVMPSYYDVVLKVKYRRDSSDTASQVLDIIHDSMTTDFAYIYNYALNSMVVSLRDLIGVQKSTDFSSHYAKNEQKYGDSLEKLIASIMEE